MSLYIGGILLPAPAFFLFEFVTGGVTLIAFSVTLRYKLGQSHVTGNGRKKSMSFLSVTLARFFSSNIERVLLFSET